MTAKISRIVQKSMMHVQSCCFVNLLPFSLTSPSSLPKLPLLSASWWRGYLKMSTTPELNMHMQAPHVDYVKHCRNIFHERNLFQLFLLSAAEEVCGSPLTELETFSKLYFFNNIYFATSLFMTILTFTCRENKNNVQERKAKYDVTAFTTN